MVSQLQHENIAEVYELARVDNNLLISMEYVDGKDLRSTAERARQSLIPLPFDHIAYIIARALDALDYAHKATDKEGNPLCIVHRDFTPSNILVSYDGRVKICDFGIAKATQSRVQTRTGVIKGKVKYMSPEQASGAKVDLRSDIFSAGSVLYELCTGEPPFRLAMKSTLSLPYAKRALSTAKALTRIFPSHSLTSYAEPWPKILMNASHREKPSAEALLEFVHEYEPGFRRSRISRLMKHLWRKEIEADLRRMEELVGGNG